MGIEVLPPNINEGALAFRVASEGKVHFGLGAIKGVGVKAVESIIKARDSGGPFRSLDEFYERISTRDVGAGCAETLIRAGAFDVFGARRSQLLAILPRAIPAGQARQDDRKRGQRGLFDDLDAAGPSGVSVNGNGHADGNGNGHAGALSNLPDIQELVDAELLGGEKKALGFYMSSHPLTRHAALLQTLATHRVVELASVPEKAEVILGGMISNVQARNVQKSRSGLTRMAKLTFEDLTGSTPAMLWPEEFAKMGDLVRNDLIGFVKGTLDRRRDPAELIISKILPIEAASAELARGVVVRLQKAALRDEDLERLLRCVRIRPGQLDLYLEVCGIQHVRRAIYKAGASLRIRYDDRLVPELENVVGSGNVRLLGPRGATARVESIGQGPLPPPAVAPRGVEGDFDDVTAEDMDDD